MYKKGFLDLEDDLECLSGVLSNIEQVEHD